MQTFISRNREYVYISREYSDASYSLGYAFHMKDVYYSMYDTLSYFKSIAQKQDFLDKYFAQLYRISNFTNKILYDRYSCFGSKFYERQDIILNQNLCGKNIFNFKDFEKYICETILD